jgi:hypothetical protein
VAIGATPIGWHRRQGRNPAHSAARGVGNSSVFVGNGLAGQPGRQKMPVVVTAVIIGLVVSIGPFVVDETPEITNA